MEDQQASRVALSDTLTDDVVQYRSLSTIAVLGLVVAVASSLALVTPWLWLAPVLGAVISAAGLWSVRSDPESRTGAGLALAGLAISVAVFAAGAVRDRTARSMNSATVEPVAQEFLDRLAAGDRVGAFELTLDLPRRQPTAEAAQKKYSDNEAAAEQLASFLADKEIKRLTAEADALRGAAVEVVDRTPVDDAPPGRSMWIWRFRLPESEAGPAAVLAIRLERPKSIGSVATAWRVATVDFEQPTN